MYFDMYGPFKLARANGRIPARQPDMWNEVRAECGRRGYEKTELERAIGCYAFGLRHGSTLRPWYVGMTLAHGGLRSEIFQPHKREHYDCVVQERRGAPIMFLLPLLTPEGRFSRDRTLSKPLVEWVEKMLFGVALKRNPGCRNQRDTKYLRNVEVRGVFNSRPQGSPGHSVSAARQMFGAEG